MKIIIQRVKKAQVSIEGQVYGQIQQGLLLLVGVGPEDQKEDLEYAKSIGVDGLLIGEALMKGLL